MWGIPSAPPGFFPLGKSLHGSEVMGAYFVSNVQFCEVYYRTEIWGSFLDYFFINYTLRPDTLARRSPFRSSRQPAELLSEVNSLHRITSPLSKLPCLATPLN